MHNSLWIRERLRELNLDPLHLERRDPHRSVGWAGDAKALEGDLELGGTWRIVGDPSIKGIRELIEDFSDYLAKVGVDVAPSGRGEIRFSLRKEVPHGGYRVSVNPGLIEVLAEDIGGLWAGAVRVEREMGIRRGPLLPRGEIVASPKWPHQISQSPWGSNYLVPDLGPEYLGDDAFRLLAHYGVNGMTIYGDALLYVNSEILPELNHREWGKHIGVLRGATERAAKYGVSLFWVPVLPKLREEHPVFSSHPEVRGARLGWMPRENQLFTLCSTSEESLAFFSELMSKMFEEVPLLGGLILIVGGESFYHCYMRPDLRGIGPDERRTNCPRCSRRTAEEVVAGFVGNVSGAVHNVKPDAVVVAWPYSAFIWSEDSDQLGLIQRLPPDSGLLSEVDKDHVLRKEGYAKRIWDYSVDFTGPSDRITHQAKACRSNGVPIYIKTETALGLEAIHMPYVPCLTRLEEKWRNVEGLCPDGVLQSWMFFGMWGSRAEELGWWRRWCPDARGNDLLGLMARREFGEAWRSVLSAWDLMSSAVGHLPCIPPYFVGPWFLGPANPLVLDGEWKPPRTFQGAMYFLQEREESLSKAMLDEWSPLVLTELPGNPSEWGFQVEEGIEAWPALVSELEEAVRLSRDAVDLMEIATRKDIAANDMDRLHEEALFMEFFHRTLLSTLNFLKFVGLRDQANEGENAVGLRAILEDELANALQSRHLYREGPWFDLSLRADGRFPSSEKMLDAKIRLLRKQLR